LTGLYLRSTGLIDTRQIVTGVVTGTIVNNS